MHIRNLIALALAITSVSSAPTLETAESRALGPVNNAIEKRSTGLLTRTPQLGDLPGLATSLIAAQVQVTSLALGILAGLASGLGGQTITLSTALVASIVDFLRARSAQLVDTAPKIAQQAADLATALAGQAQGQFTTSLIAQLVRVLNDLANQQSATALETAREVLGLLREIAAVITRG